jgi:putative radical SAM enzyme (TIGR03279 family)
MPKSPGGVIAVVEPGSLGEAIGLAPGDRLVSINGQTLRDIIDVQFYGAEERLELVVEREGQNLLFDIERDYDEELGLLFVNPTFDVDIRRCANNCDFCFVKQNARGMRRSLYIKDDDYRYSFLFGNFVTLTNLTDDDWARLEEQRLSPLYVSVHATELDLRQRFLAREGAPDVIAQLHRLASLEIKVHTQVVLVPGLNDGKHLARTVADLTALYQQPVASLSIVPIGLTKYHHGQCRTYTADGAQAVLDQLEMWHAESLAGRGCSFVYPSDEWYLVAGRAVPPAEAYDGFPQVENGVGMVRQMLDEVSAMKMASKASHLDLGSRSATLVCGTLIAPILDRLVGELRRFTGAKLGIVPVVNEFFGKVTTVSGLLTGGDVVAALQSRFLDVDQGGSMGEVLFLPRVMFTGSYGAGTAPPGTTLDDMHISEISAQLGVRAEMAGSLKEVVAALTDQR